MVEIHRKTLSALELFDSATVQNALITLQGYVEANIDYTDPSIHRMIDSKPCIVGIAVTSSWTPITLATVQITDKNEFYENIKSFNLPVVSVLKDVDNESHRGAIIGDGMAYIMKAMGAVAAVVDGNARDVPGIKQAGIDLWATGRVPGHGPFNMIEQGQDLVISGLLIRTGDVLVCDGDGITRIEPRLLNDVIRACQEVRAKEAKIHKYFSSPDFDSDAWESWKNTN
ncbi:MAG: hypothetical protein QF908_00930 [Dehalococcoidia bacterium]|jgi:regulator of RNase E activity RraA|nr:hypothetical protein [Dehalococcoidia bacterium]